MIRKSGKIVMININVGGKVGRGGSAGRRSLLAPVVLCLPTV